LREAMADESKNEFDFIQIVEFVIRSIRINYRITPEVASYLRLLNTYNAINPALYAAIGVTPDREVK